MNARDFIEGFKFAPGILENRSATYKSQIRTHMLLLRAMINPGITINDSQRFAIEKGLMDIIMTETMPEDTYWKILALATFINTCHG